ncbi:MAG: hypothetical protein BAJALOKI1v1_280005 [Promethearchaeota archaeon]|nr:MAG: hypothetical protein BAJALOKI1v1_280005 [Candidatus Lokiarchaeota archaeon]
MISKTIIKIAGKENLFDLNICAEEFIELIDNFKSKFLKKQFFILMAYYNSVLAGILVAEDKSKKVDSLEKIVPTMSLKLLFVNPNYRDMGLGKKLVNCFIMLLLKKDFASISIELPKNYREGIHFFLQNDFLSYKFRQREKVGNKVILRCNLWNDYGIRDCQLIQLDSQTLY